MSHRGHGVDIYTSMAYHVLAIHLLASDLSPMVVIESHVFTKQVLRLLTDEEYSQLQLVLIMRPETGPVIPGSGGLRKIRWQARGRGKRGGVRVIYYWAASHERILLLYMYAKTEQEDLTPDQLKALRLLVEVENP